jgi:hypothetical protein
VLFAVALSVRADRRWIWWSVGLLLVLNLVFGVVAYFPGVHAARPMNVLDWAEGTAYTGLLLAALGCVVLNLTGTTLAPTPREGSAAPSAAGHDWLPSPDTDQPNRPPARVGTPREPGTQERLTPSASTTNTDPAP